MSFGLRTRIRRIVDERWIVSCVLGRIKAGAEYFRACDCPLSPPEGLALERSVLPVNPAEAGTQKRFGIA